MKISRVVAGASLATLLALAGCTSADETPEENANAVEDTGSDEDVPDDDAADEGASDDDGSDEDGSDEDLAGAGDCPELSEGVSVEVSALAQCSQEAVDAAAGYAAESEMLGMASVLRVNNDPQALHMDSDLGEIINIEGQAWVNVEGEWHEGDPDSADPMVAALSAAADEAAAQADPAAQLELMGQVDLTVTGTDTRLGQDVFVITGSGEEVDDLTYYIAADYAVLAADVSMTVEGMEVSSIVEVTEWDAPQEINAPM